MNITNITIRNDIPHQEFNVTLDGTSYTFEVRWSAREEAHYLDISTEDNSKIVAGMKLALGVVIGSRAVDERMPPGLLWCVDTSLQYDEAGEQDMGARVQLRYMNAALLRLVNV